MLLTSGTRLGAYEIIAPLGVGGMGEVYRARDTKLGRLVAVKVLPAELSSNADRLARFEREARTVAGLSHPNIVVLHSMEEEGGTHFLTMELVEGQSLDRHVTPDGLPVARVIELGIALADALTAAHERGVIHRDLKPANVMLTHDARIKVLDFGLAKLARLDESPDSSHAATVTTPISRAGDVLGTVPYMAPEQIRGESVDARSDLFALGVLLYELTAGRRPFTGSTLADIGSSILRDAPMPLARVRANVPQDLERIVSRCLEKNPRERFQTALDVSNELRGLRRVLERSESGAMATPAREKVASIAVLPFANRSASADDEYFSDGLADELLNMLAKIQGLRVAARASAFQFKGRSDDVAVVGQKLNVATLLDGSVRKVGDRVRIAVQLVKVADGYHLWSETYDRTLKDIFAVQDDIAHAVVSKLRATLLGEEPDSDASVRTKAEIARAARGRGTDPEAHRLYLLARFLLDRWTREDTTKAIEYLREALALDPGCALAWAELSRAYAGEAHLGWTGFVDGYGRARAAVDRALALDPDLPEGHARDAWIRIHYDRDLKGAEALYARALELSPENADLLRGAGLLAWILGRLDEAITLHQQALAVDPLSASCYNNLGIVLHSADRFDESELAYRKGLELSPRGSETVRAHHSLNLLALGRGEEALSEALREPEERSRLWALAIVHHALHRGAESDAALDELIESHALDSAYRVAEVYGARGDVDKAFEWLQQAQAQRDNGQTKTSPRLRALHGDPRWGAWLKKMGLED